MTTPPTMPIPWQHALGAKVRYMPYHADIPLPEAWRVVCRIYAEAEQMRPAVQYTIQPWTLSGTYMCDRPLVVFADQLTAFAETPHADAS